MLKNEYKYYTSKELFEIFKEQHRLFSPLDPVADEYYILKRETKIWELQEAQDLLPWDKYGDFLNQMFKIQVPRKNWKTILESENTLGNLCDFLSTVAKKEIHKPITILGKECLSASIFLTLKNNLKNKGVNVENLKPSTNIAEFIDINKNFSPVMEEATITGVETFKEIKLGRLETDRRYKYWIDKIFPHWVYKRPLSTGEIKTFRDLVEKIMENKKLGITQV